MEKTIEEQIRDAENVAESQVVIESDDKLEVEMTPTQLKSAGLVYIYDTRTYERSLCNRNNLVHALQKRRPDGSIVFTTTKPKAKPKRGSFRCLLHAESPDRLHYDDLGLPTCRKENLTSPYQVTRHMQKRHKTEYAAIKEEEAREEKDRERKLRESLIKLANKK